MDSINVFISYPREDERSASALARALASSGMRFFSFRHTPTLPGADFTRDIEVHIRQAHIVALLWGQDANVSEWTRREIELAQRYRRPIIPVLLDEFTPLPESLSHTQAILAYDDPAGWILQFRDFAFYTFQQIKEKKNRRLKTLAGGILTAGVMGALAALGNNEG